MQVTVRPGPAHALKRLDELGARPKICRAAAVPSVGVGLQVDVGIGRLRVGSEVKDAEEGQKGEEGHPGEEGVVEEAGHGSMDCRPVFLVEEVLRSRFFERNEGGGRKRKELEDGGFGFRVPVLFFLGRLFLPCRRKKAIDCYQLVQSMRSEEKRSAPMRRRTAGEETGQRRNDRCRRPFGVRERGKSGSVSLSARSYWLFVLSFARDASKRYSTCYFKR